MVWSYKESCLIFAICLLLSAATQSFAKMYRWTDAQGHVHYSDKVPPEHVGQARSRIDNRGMEVEEVEAAKTREEIERGKELERLRVEKQRLIDEQKARDRVLLRTFRSEDDILMTRDGKQMAIDTSIQIIRSNIRRLKLNLATMQKNAANLERQGQSISADYIQDIENTRQQLKNNYEVIIRKEQDKEAVREKYATDVVRFRDLKNLRQDQDQDQQKKRIRSLLETVVICNNQPDCDAAWIKAEEYVRKHATTRLQMLAKSIIMTAAPIKPNDISITVSRIRMPDTPGARLFMDLQCKESPRGRDFCETGPVDNIRSSFRIYLQKLDVMDKDEESVASQ